MKRTPEEIGAKIDGLGIWSLLERYNFAVKPRGTAFPYFCTVMAGDGKAVKVRLLMLEGWQTLHVFVRTRMDINYGCHSTPMEFPHLEMVVLLSGEIKFFRYDTGYVPQEPHDAQRELLAKLLWEIYGVMLRVETDNRLPLRFADEKAIFARIETQPGVWSDEPLTIPDPPPEVERISFHNDDLKAAKDLPMLKEEALELDFRLLPGIMTKEPRPRCVYGLTAIDAKTGETVIDLRSSVHPEVGLRGMWEMMPGQVLKAMVSRGKVPGEIMVRSGRVFRFLRPLGMELPFKLSMHDRLPHFPDPL